MAYALNHNIEAFFARVPLERVGFFTLTLTEDLSAREAQRRLRSLKENVLRSLFHSWIGVLERTRRNRIHYHFLVDTGGDIRTGFDFAALEEADDLAHRGLAKSPAAYRAKARYGRSASHHLRNIWRLTSVKRMQGYGLGIAQTVPIKRSGEAVAIYVAKYIGKHVGQRRPDDLRAKGVYLSQENRRATSNLAWNSPGAKRWRTALANVAGELHCGDSETLCLIYGPRWAWDLAGIIHREQDRLAALEVAA